MTDAEIDAALDKLSLSVAETISAVKLHRAIFRAGMREAARILENGAPLDRPAASIIRAAAGEGEG